jgi:hypothetical protein
VRKKDGSSLDKGHYFVLAPLGGIGSYFRAGELVGVAHVLDAVLIVLLHEYVKSALREA